MKLFKYIAILFFVVSIFIYALLNFSNGLIFNNELQPDKNYPRWIFDGKKESNQTSGIVFVNASKNQKNFLLADDVGEIYLLKIKNDTIFSLNKIDFSDKVNKFFEDFVKKDFEDITYDKFENKFYISIEGNKPNTKQEVGVYQLEFDKDFSKVKSVKKIEIKPENKFLQYVDDNIGYEGLAVDEKYFYLGLEGFAKKNLFSDSTIIFVVDKKEKKIIKEISTKSVGIQTVCGLFADKNNSLWGVDRNNRKIFHLTLNKNLDIETNQIYDFNPSIPKFKNYSYVAAIESITLDDENNIYITDDPWKEFFIPNKTILSYLDNETIKNFEKYIPIIYKYHIPVN
ncbi:MAG: hypothetical protein STSR0008_19980 [Ignavibacterium sp.]